MRRGGRPKKYAKCLSGRPVSEFAHFHFLACFGTRALVDCNRTIDFLAPAVYRTGQGQDGEQRQSGLRLGQFSQQADSPAVIWIRCVIASRLGSPDPELEHQPQPHESPYGTVARETAPSRSSFQDPMKCARSKCWSIFSAAKVGYAGRTPRPIVNGKLSPWKHRSGSSFFARNKTCWLYDFLSALRSHSGLTLL